MPMRSFTQVSATSVSARRHISEYSFWTETGAGPPLRAAAADQWVRPHALSLLSPKLRMVPRSTSR